MIDLIKPTTPSVGQEHVGRTKPHNAGETNILNVPDPTKVTKTNQQTVYTERQNEKFVPNFQSNFDQFLSILRNTPGLSSLYPELFFSKMGSLIQSGLSQGFTEEVNQYMKLLNMTEGELLNFLKSQQSTSVKFNGPFFDMLRQVLGGSVSQDVKGAIVDFLQKYDSMSSSNHILNNIISNLTGIAHRIPGNFSTELMGLIEKLNTGNGTLDNQTNLENLNILKSEIIPFLSSYVSRTHDFGAVRDLISLVVLNLARYENGTEESFTKSFRGLMGYSEIKSLMDGISMQDLEKFFLNNPSQNQSNALVDKLINIISRGMGGEAGSQSRIAFQNILSSMLINESVYMPLVHITLPADVNGQMFFSEIWIDPEAQGSSELPNPENAFKLLIKFDIKDVGFFETVLLVQDDNKIFVDLSYPEEYAYMDRTIKEGINDILTKNDFQIQLLSVGKLVKPKTISEVFPKIYEGRNAVNVTI